MGIICRKIHDLTTSTDIWHMPADIKLLRTCVPDNMDLVNWIVEHIMPCSEDDIVREINFLASLKYASNDTV